MKMSFNQAKLVLGLQNCMPSLTEEIVVAAWRAAVKQNHPDTTPHVLSYDNTPRATYTMELLTTAKIFLLNHLTGDDLACKLCRGTGKVPAKMGLRTCVACNGTGDRR